MAKILIIGINFTPELIGVGKYTGELAEFLSKQGDEVRVITAPPHYPNWSAQAPYHASAYAHESKNSLTITRCPIVLRNHGRGIWRLIAPLTFAATSFFPCLRNILFWRPDVVLCIEPAFASSIAPAVLARICGIRRVIHVQDLEIDAAIAVGYISNPAFKAFAFVLEKFVLKQFHEIITISEKMRDRLSEKLGSAHKIKVIRNWIEPDLFKAANGTRARQTYSITDEIFVVLYSGHIGKKQDLATVLHAAEELAVCTGIQFIIAGDGTEKSDLQMRFKHLENVLWLPLLPTNEFKDLLKAADCHLLPQHESAADLVLPSKLGAILATGAPLVVTSQPNTELAHLLHEHATLSPPGDHKKLAAAILKTRHDKPDLKIARRELTDRFSADYLLPEFRNHLLYGE